MLSSLKGWFAAAGALLLAALLFVVGQRDKARAKVKQVKVQKETVEATREVERATTKAQAAAREKTNATRKAHEKRPSGERPDGNFRR